MPTEVVAREKANESAHQPTRRPAERRSHDGFIALTFLAHDLDRVGDRVTVLDQRVDHRLAGVSAHVRLLQDETHEERASHAQNDADHL